MQLAPSRIPSGLHTYVCMLHFGVILWHFYRFRIHINIEHEIDYFDRNPGAFKGSIEVDKDVQLLTDIGSTIGICLPTDYGLVRVSAYFN